MHKIPIETFLNGHLQKHPNITQNWKELKKGTYPDLLPFHNTYPYHKNSKFSSFYFKHRSVNEKVKKKKFFLPLWCKPWSWRNHCGLGAHVWFQRRLRLRGRRLWFSFMFLLLCHTNIIIYNFKNPILYSLRKTLLLKIGNWKVILLSVYNRKLAGFDSVFNINFFTLERNVNSNYSF